MPINTVLFDLDDTLLDSLDARIEALNQVFQQANIFDNNAAQFLQDLGGSQLKGALEALGKSRNIQDDLFIGYRRAYWLKNPGYIRVPPASTWR
jgi:phosphoglycolate phosphatase-like HAD superfamily hydrolase